MHVFLIFVFNVTLQTSNPIDQHYVLTVNVFGLEFGSDELFSIVVAHFPCLHYRKICFYNLEIRDDLFIKIALVFDACLNRHFKTTFVNKTNLDFGSVSFLCQWHVQISETKISTPNKF